MKILLAGPIETRALGQSTGIDLSGLPDGVAHTPLAPLSAGLLAAGHEVHLVTLDPTVETRQEYHYGRLTITFCPLRGPPRYRTRVRARDLFAEEIASLAETMARSDADIVHAHWAYEYAEAAIRSRKPALITMHDLGWNVLLAFRDLYRTVRLVMTYRVLTRAKHVTAVSPSVASKAWQYGHFGRVDVIPNPIEEAPAPPKSLDRPIIVTVGNDTRLKNVAASVAAFSTIRSAFPAAELHLFGPGLGPDGRFGSAGAGVVCHGNVPHDYLMRYLEKEATLLIHPSRTEACPVILGEAKMRGVPVIGGRKSGGVPYVVGNAGGIVVDIEKPEEIASAAIDILSDRRRYAEMQRSAHQDALARFVLKQIVADYGAVYRRILGGG